MNKFSIIFLTLAVLSTTNPALAHEEGNLPIQAATVNLGIEEPGLLPTNPFYFLKEWRRSLRLLLTFDRVKKAELESNFNNEKAAELDAVAETFPENYEAINEAITNYQASQERLKDRIASLPDHSENPNVSILLENITDRTLRHARLFAELEDKFVENEPLQDSIKLSKNRFGEMLADVSRKSDPAIFSDTAVKAATELQSIEVLESLVEQLPEEAASRVSEVIEKLKTEIAPAQAPAFPETRTAPPVIVPETEKMPEPAPEEDQVLCIQVYEPVCGKDGKTYSNSCTAGVAGVEIQSKGECPIPEKEREAATTPAPAESRTPEMQGVARELTLEADDSGFYPAGNIEVPKGAKVMLTFVVRQANVYFGGLDFRSSKFQTDPVKPGGSTTVEFVADESFTISSYWPASGVLKANIEVIAE